MVWKLSWSTWTVITEFLRHCVDRQFRGDCGRLGDSTKEGGIGREGYTNGSWKQDGREKLSTTIFGAKIWLTTPVGALAPSH